MQFGYARVSNGDPDTAVQMAALKTAGYEREYPGIPKSRLNLLSNGRNFVAAFTKILVDEINGVRP